MRAIIQRVSHCGITIDREIKRRIGKGCLVLLGIEEADSIEDIEWLAGKISRLRIFNDEEGKMNLSVREINGEVMVVSQFTLHASTKKGNRPSYIRSADPKVSEPIYIKFVKVLQEMVENPIVTGEFGAYMEIELLNDGPVTLFIDTKNKE